MASAHGLKPSTVDESDVTADRHRNNALDTHRYLRGGVVVLIVMLGAAVLGQRLASTCWQTSISAYCHTAAHNVFIAAICGIGVLMIVADPARPAAAPSPLTPHTTRRPPRARQRMSQRYIR
jgi:hypothetical protein